MYRIRLASGEEAVYKTVEELAQAVDSGVISPSAEVFHRAGNRWLPINTHPDYRNLVSSKQKAIGPFLAEEEPAQDRPGPSDGPTRKSEAIQDHSGPPNASTRKSQAIQDHPGPSDASTRKSEAIQDHPGPSDASTRKSQAIQFEVVAPAPGPATPVPAPFAEVEALPPIILDPVSPPEGSADFILPPGFERPKRPIAAMVLGLASLLLAAGMAAVLLTRPPGVGGTVATVQPEVEGMAPAPDSLTSMDAAPSAVQIAPTLPEQALTPPPAPESATKAVARPDTVAVAYPAPSKPLAPANKPAPQPEAPPPRVISRLGTTVNKVPSYYAAYADARAEMDEGLAYVDFRRVFAPARFSSADSIRAARRMVAAAGNILRVYRGREVMLEQTYRPGEPEGKGSLRETFEVAQASRGLLADVDSLFAILVTQEGEVRYRDNSLYFRNSRAEQAYSGIRRRILQSLAYLGDPAEAADRVTMPRLLRGFGTDRPPPAR